MSIICLAAPLRRCELSSTHKGNAELTKLALYIGLGTEFRSEKIPRNRLGMISVIQRKKVLIPRHSEFRGRANSEARNRTERNGIPRKNEVLRNSHCTASMITLTSNTIIEILGCRVLCWAGFSSAEWFGTEFRQFASIFFPRNRIPSCFLFHSRVRKGILRVFFYFCIHGKEFRVVFSSAEVFGKEFREFASTYFCSTERNSELFSFSRKGSERNSEVFCSAEQPEFRRK